MAELRASCATTTESAKSSALVSPLDIIGAERVYNVRVSRKGAFGEVRMCVHRETGAQRAVKVLRKSHMDEDEKRMLFNEINILKEIVSPSDLSPLSNPRIPRGSCLESASNTPNSRK